MAKTNGQKRKISLPGLLPGSEFKSDDPGKYRTVNFLGRAIAIVIQAQKDAIGEDSRKALLEAFEIERKEVEKFEQKLSEFYRQYPRQPGDLEPSPTYPPTYRKNIQGWLEKSLLEEIKWVRLYQLIEIQVLMYRIYDNARAWWKNVQSVCRRVEMKTDSAFDPISEIQKISGEYSGGEVEQSKAGKRKSGKTVEGKRSKPMSKSKMMTALGIDSYKTFNAFAKGHGIKQAGNRQTFTILLDNMDEENRRKLENA